MGRNVKKPVRRRGAKRQAERRGGRKKKRVAFDVVTTTILIVAICVFAFSLFQLVKMLIPYYSGGKEYDKLKDKAITIETTKDSEDTSEARFKVDFDVLLQENPDTVAWIRFDEPSIISYPVVKSADNKEYLTKTFTESDNKLGAIFMDMRNTSDKKEFRAGSIFIASENENPFVDLNTVIYGHNMKIGGEMFSQLKEYEEESFYKEHPNFYIYTPDGKTRTYTVFSAAVVKDTADQYNLTYATDEAFESYLKMCKEDSAYDTGTEVNAQSQIVSLSTCTNVREDERFLLQGVLTATDGGED